MNSTNTKNSMIVSKNWTLNAAAAAAARKKIGGGLTGLSTTSTPWKFDGAGVYQRPRQLRLRMP